MNAKRSHKMAKRIIIFYCYCIRMTPTNRISLQLEIFIVVCFRYKFSHFFLLHVLGYLRSKVCLKWDEGLICVNNIVIEAILKSHLVSELISRGFKSQTLECHQKRVANCTTWRTKYDSRVKYNNPELNQFRNRTKDGLKENLFRIDLLNGVNSVDVVISHLETF